MERHPHDLSVSAPRLLVIAVFITLFGLAAPSPTAGQNGFDFEVDLGEVTTTRDVMWSPDSQTLVFVNTGLIENRGDNDVLQGVELTQPIWQAFDLTSGTLSSHFIWPLQPLLTADEIASYRSRGFIFASPDDSLLLFAQDTLEEPRFVRPLVIAKRGTDQVLNTEYRVDILPQPGAEFGNARVWNPAGTALAVSYGTPANEINAFHVRFEGSDLQSATITDFRPVIDGHEYFTFWSPEDVVHSISTSGNCVLLTGRRVPPADKTPYEMPPEWVVWCPDQPEANRVLFEYDRAEIRAGSFAPNSETQLLFVTDEELYLYDSVTQQKLMTLRDDLGALDFSWAVFSPDGAWLALYAPGHVFVTRTSND